MKNTLLLIISLLIVACSTKESSQGENFESNIKGSSNDEEVEVSLDFFDKEKNPKAMAFEAVPFGQILPDGWIIHMMNEDMTKGLVGNLDVLAPEILIEDDLFNTERRMSKDDIPAIKDMVLTGAAWEQSIQWWNSESFGNWWDGYVRNAYLTGNKEAIKKSKKMVDYLVSTQDEDGYIGIYGPDLRYQHEGSNGELWAQTTIFRMLIGYYEVTKDQKVLEAVEKAMALTMEKYNENATSPFDLENAFGGVTHGLMMTDVCEMLFRITKNQAYADYAVFLYKDFSTYPINRAFNDLRYAYLLQDTPFQSHAVHTYEHLRSLIFANYVTGFDELDNALSNALKKLSDCILPSGGGIGDEWIAGQKADPDLTAGEFCSQFELREFFGSAFQKTGDPSWADKYEKITFNTIIGMRNHNGTAITYCKMDNSYKVDGTSAHGKDLRFKYSPTHTDVALCCSPNYGKHLPYFVGQMWMKAEDGLVATLYGPSKFSTTVENSEVTIHQVTNYPFSNQVTFQISIDEPSTFSIYLRKPSWVKEMKIESGSEPELVEGFYRIQKEWKDGDSISISFDYEVETIPFNDEVYFQHGPIIYAKSIPFNYETIKTYDHAGFTDYLVHPKEKVTNDLAYDSSRSKFSFFSQNDENIWSSNSYQLRGNLYDKNSGASNEVRLIPFGSTNLRKVTFSVLQ